MTTYTHVYPYGVYPSGSTQKFNVKAMNGVGYGAASTNFSVTADTPPITYVTLSSSNVHPTNVTISWTTITGSTNTGGDNVSYYQLSWYDSSLNSWSVVNTDQTTLVTTYIHVYPYGVFPSGSI